MRQLGELEAQITKPGDTGSFRWEEALELLEPRRPDDEFRTRARTRPRSRPRARRS